MKRNLNGELTELVQQDYNLQHEKIKQIENKIFKNDCADKINSIQKHFQNKAKKNTTHDYNPLSRNYKNDDTTS